MLCPRCGHDLSPAVPQCTACDFHLPDAQQMLGADWVRVERLIDHAQCLSLRDAHGLQLMLDEFERRFPQLFAVVFFGGLPAQASPSEAAFWLLNHAIAVRNDQARSGHWGIALVIDAAHKQAGLAFGYALESLLPHNFSLTALQNAIPHFAHGELKRGVRSIFADVQKQLVKLGSSAPRSIVAAPSQAQSHLGLETVTTDEPASVAARPAVTLPPRR